MIKLLKHLYFLLGVTFVAATFSSAYYADQANVSSNSFTTGRNSPGDVVMNEVMPNPDGNDNAWMPGGEWVELYNQGSWPINVRGWKICSGNAMCITITPNRLNQPSIIPVHGWLVVYRNGGSDFNLLDSGNQAILLFNSTGLKVDEMQYIDSTQGQTWSKKPDGTGGWVGGQTPTPGGVNGA